MFKITFGCVFQMFTLMSFSSPAMITSNISAKYPLRISNGEPAYLGEIPYQIALKLASDSFRFRYYTICGGALIGNSKILTAAHCFFSEKARGRVCDCSDDERIQLSRLCAVAGTLRNIGYYGWDGGVEQWRRLNVTVIHPSFKFPDNDIAVVYTKHPFVMNVYVKTLPYARRNQNYGSALCKISGYGRISASITSDSLLWANLSLIPNDYCDGIHRRSMQKFICTSSDHSDVLQGDSGGPLVCRVSESGVQEDVVVGVVCGVRLGYGSFFTRVSSYSDFVSRSISTRLKTTCLYILLTNYIRVLLILLLFSYSHT
ncbi:chymotrypsin-1-like [Choristoneura fumiferana]|uniref:chymotrypsin-1-like n=1 Tax=Choristoneura fumiferana TaxID=7141 RepID=UPI003D15B36C